MPAYRRKLRPDAPGARQSAEGIYGPAFLTPKNYS